MKKILLSILTILLCSVFLFIYTQKSIAPTWQEQYDLGVRYLSEGKYEEAIIAFTSAIEIDPRQSAPYIAIADIYILQDQYEDALSILSQGVENTESSSMLISKLSEVESLLLPLDDSQIDDNDEHNSTEENLPLYNQQTGLLLQEKWYNENGLWLTTEYTYNDKGICIEEIATFVTGELCSHIRWDDYGNVISEWHYYDEGYTAKFENIYDNDGRLIKTIESNGEETEYIYSEDGKLVKTISSDGTISEYTYIDDGFRVDYVTDATYGCDIYDSEGNLVFEEWSWNPDLNRDYAGKLINRQIYEYDEDGNMIAFISPQITTNVWHPEDHDIEQRRVYEYEFDAEGYPKKRIEFLNGQLTSDHWEYIYS